MRLAMVVAVALSVLPVAPAAAADDASPTIIFDQKSFIDTGRMVHVEGTLTGKGIGYKNNHTVLTCYHQRRECSAIQIDSQGLQVFSTNLPLPYTIRAWTDDRIMADGDLPCGGHETWIIDRPRQTAELIEHPCSTPRSIIGPSRCVGIFTLYQFSACEATAPPSSARSPGGINAWLRWTMGATAPRRRGWR